MDRQLARVLVAHNFYRWPGGEDAVVEEEIRLLRDHGHAVELLARRSDDADNAHPLRLARQAVWSEVTSRECTEIIGRFKPDIVHLHNTVPLISPSIVWAARRAGVPVVQTLHNFRLLCPQAMLLRDGAICEACVGKLPWRSVAYGCYRGSRAQSAVMTATSAVHGLLGTYRRRVARFIALSEFARRKFMDGGLPAERIVVKCNSVDLPAPEPTDRSGGLFVGRLSPEKGTRILAEAAAAAGASLKVVGDGPEEPLMRSARSLTLLGARPPAEVYGHMRRALFLVMPSLWYEGFPLVLAEAYACGLPVIASRLGALAEFVVQDQTGLLVEPGSVGALGEAVRWAIDHPERMLEMGREARSCYEAHFTGEQNYRALSHIYAGARGAGEL
jgi:glycosyltransferase involved in cell wall biosynthesis